MVYHQRMSDAEIRATFAYLQQQIDDLESMNVPQPPVANGILYYNEGISELDWLQVGSGLQISIDGSDSYLVTNDGGGGGGGGGDVTDADNIGSGDVGIFKQKNGSILEFKTLEGGTNIEFVDDTANDRIIVNATGSASGEANTASNIGSGDVGIFKQKTGVDLEFKELFAGANITLTDDVANDRIIIEGEAGGGSATGVSNVKDFGAVGDGTGGGGITQADIDAHPEWEGTYLIGTTWDTVGIKEAIIDAFAANGASAVSNPVEVWIHPELCPGPSQNVNLLNGNTAGNSNDLSTFFTGGVAVANKTITFEFHEQVTITEATWYQSDSSSHGTWQWDLSQDLITWTPIGSTFTLGGATTQVQTSLSANTTAAWYYRLRGVSGVTSGTPWINQIQFEQDVGGTPTYITGNRSSDASIVWNSSTGGAGISANKELYFPTGTYVVNKRLLSVMSGFRVTFASRSSTKIQWTGNPDDPAWVCDASSYGRFDNLTMEAGVKSNANLFTLDWSGNNPGLKTQNLSFYDAFFIGNGLSYRGVVISPSGGGAQGDNVVFWNKQAVGFIRSWLCLIGQNTLHVKCYGGDQQGNRWDGVECYGATYIGDAETCENQQGSYNFAPPSSQIINFGADVHIYSGAGFSAMNRVSDNRSESDVAVVSEVVNVVVKNYRLDTSGIGSNGFFAEFAYMVGYCIGPTTNNDLWRTFMVVDDGVDGGQWRQIDWAASGSGSGDLIVDDSGVSYTDDELIGKTLHLRYSNGFVERYEIESNTSNTFTLTTSIPSFGPESLYTIGGMTDASAPDFDTAEQGGVYTRFAGATGFTMTAGSTTLTMTGGFAAFAVGDYVVVQGAARVGYENIAYPVAITALIARVVSVDSPGVYTLSRAADVDVTEVYGYYGTGIVSGDITFLHVNYAAFQRCYSIENSAAGHGRLFECADIKNCEVYEVPPWNDWMGASTTAWRFDLIGQPTWKYISETLPTSGTIDLTTYFNNAGDVFTVTPTGDMTLDAPVPYEHISAHKYIIVTTSGTTSFDITPGANFADTTPIATGTVSGVETVLEYISNGAVWVRVNTGTGGGGGGGDVTGATNIGSGDVGIFKQETSGVLEFKELFAGTNITLTDDTANDRIVIDAAGGGVADGDKGDITVSGGGATWTIDDGVVTYAKMQDVSATDRILGRDTAGAGDVEELTVSGGLEFTGTGIQRSALTGDITASAGSNSTTIPNDTVTYAKMQNISATARFLGRITSGAGDTEELTGTQATTLLDLFSTSATTKGLAPGSNGAGATFYLDGTGSWSVPAGSGGVSDGDKTDITVSSSGTVWTIDNNVVTFAKMQDIATDRLIGRDTASTGDPEEITVGGGVEFTGSGGIQRSALTGDVTASAGSNATTIANDAVTTAKILNDAVTYAKIQNVSATDRILGRDTAAAGDIEELTVSGGLEFTGGPGIQRSALTGDVTATAGSNATTLATVNSNTGTFGSATQVGQFTVNGKGLITAASNVTITVPTAASTTEVLTGTDTAKFVTADALAALWEKGADEASAATVSFGEGGFFHITGTTTITDIDWDTAKNGRAAWVVFDAALTLTHNATTLILPGGANITTAAGDRALFIQDAADNVYCMVYQRAASQLASTTEVLTGTDTAKTVTPDALAALWEKGSNVASAATVSLGEGGFFHITGTTTITDIDWATAKDGRVAHVIFDGALTLTHNATTLILPGGANITTAAGDRAGFVQDATDNVICLYYVRAAVAPVALASTTEVLTGTDTAKTVTPDAMAAIWEKGSDVASAATVSLGEGGFFHITGTTTITDIDFATAKDGRTAYVVFDGILTLTHNATTLKLPGGANITTAAGDRAIFIQDSSDNVICINYHRAAGPVDSASKSQTDTIFGLLGGTITDGTYLLGVNLPIGFTITSATTKCTAGTATATFKIDSTALGGTANSVSTAENTQSHASANTFAAGNDLNLTISSASSLANLSFSLTITRTLS